MFDRRNILGIPIDNLTMESTLDKIFTLLADKTNNSSNYIATVNVDFIVNTLNWSYETISDLHLYTILKSAFLITADGMPLVWCSKLLGNGISGRVTGSDLIPTLATHCANKGKSLFILGGKEEVNQKAIEILKNRNPNLKIAGSYSNIIKLDKSNPFGIEKEDEAIVEQINNSGADILLIALGNPKQEYWYYKNTEKLKIKVSIGIGGTLDFISGNIKRAPKWMQKTGLEWIYRFMQEPSRMWKRYTKDIALYVSLILFPIFYYQFRRILFSKELASLELNTKGNQLHIKLPNNLNTECIEQLEQRINAIKPVKLVFDFSHVKLINNISLSYLFHLSHLSKTLQRELEFQNVNSIVHRFFRFNRLLPEFKELIRV